MGSSQPRDWTYISYVSCIVRQILYCWATWEGQQHHETNLISGTSYVASSDSATILVPPCSTSQTWKTNPIFHYGEWNPFPSWISLFFVFKYTISWSLPIYFFISSLRYFLCFIVFLYLIWSYRQLIEASFLFLTICFLIACSRIHTHTHTHTHTEAEISCTSPPHI